MQGLSEMPVSASKVNRHTSVSIADRQVFKAIVIEIGGGDALGSFGRSAERRIAGRNLRNQRLKIGEQLPMGGPICEQENASEVARQPQAGTAQECCGSHAVGRIFSLSYLS
jgi:hypothetical protein